MLREIAVLLGKDGQTIEMSAQGEIAVYHCVYGIWQKTRQQKYDMTEVSVGQMRKKMAEILAFLGDCKVFAAKSVTGIYYYELEKAAVSVWEVPGKTEEFIDDIAKKEVSAANKAATKPRAVPMPTEIAAGRYFISIKDIQENNAGITSKQVLLPFLQQKPFYSLEILCSHIPPWLEAELLCGRLASEVTKIGKKEVKVVIMKACCS